jgi:hypothetical protein
MSRESIDDTEQRLAQGVLPSGERRPHGLDALERGALRRRRQFQRSKDWEASERTEPATAEFVEPIPRNPSRPTPAGALLAPTVEASDDGQLEAELRAIGHRLTALQDEQARHHLALKLLAANWTQLSRENVHWRAPVEDFRLRLEAVERQLSKPTLVLPPRPPGDGQSADPTERNVELKDQVGKPAVRLGTVGRAIQPTWFSTAALTGIALALLAISFRLLSG